MSGNASREVLACLTDTVSFTWLNKSCQNSFYLEAGVNGKRLKKKVISLKLYQTS